MRYRLLTASVIALLSFNTTCAQAKDPAGDGKQIAITYPEAPMPAADFMIEPPQEYHYFPMREDGQAYQLDNETGVNLTDQLNHTTFDPKTRGERYGKWQCWEIVEKGCLSMPTWPQYDEAVESGVLTGVNKWFEKWSGYGPP